MRFLADRKATGIGFLKQRLTISVLASIRDRTLA
jgi:hypothetical protein